MTCDALNFAGYLCVAPLPSLTTVSGSSLSDLRCGMVTRASDSLGCFDCFPYYLVP